jgi:hypothetical protein
MKMISDFEFRISNLWKACPKRETWWAGGGKSEIRISKFEMLPEER